MKEAHKQNLSTPAHTPLMIPSWWYSEAWCFQQFRQDIPIMADSHYCSLILHEFIKSSFKVTWGGVHYILWEQILLVMHCVKKGFVFQYSQVLILWQREKNFSRSISSWLPSLSHSFPRRLEKRGSMETGQPNTAKLLFFSIRIKAGLAETHQHAVFSKIWQDRYELGLPFCIYHFQNRLWEHTGCSVNGSVYIARKPY